MKKAMWLASVVCLAVAAWATTVSVPAQAAGSYASQESSENGDLARHRGGSSGGYGSSGGRSRSRGSHGGSSGGRSRRSRGSHGSHGSHG